MSNIFGFRSSQLDNNFNEHKHVNGCVTGLAALKASTLHRHYYPEGNWGWVIVIVAFINIFLTHGLQLSSSLFLLPAGIRFHQNYVNSTGKSIFFFLKNKNVYLTRVYDL